MTFTPNNKIYTAITIDVAVSVYVPNVGLSAEIVVNSYPEIENGDVTGNIECMLKNADANVLSGKVYTALYDNDSRLVGVVMSDIPTVDSGTATAFSIPVAWSGLDKTSYEIKIFIWGSDFSPLVETAVIELD